MIGNESFLMQYAGETTYAHDDVNHISRHCIISEYCNRSWLVSEYWIGVSLLPSITRPAPDYSKPA